MRSNRLRENYTTGETLLPSIIINGAFHEQPMQKSKPARLPRLPDFIGDLSLISEDQQGALMIDGVVTVEETVIVESQVHGIKTYTPASSQWTIKYENGRIIYYHDGWAIEVDGRITRYAKDGKYYDQIRPSGLDIKQEAVLVSIRALLRQGYKPDLCKPPSRKIFFIKGSDTKVIDASGAQAEAYDYLEYYFSDLSRNDPNVQIPKYLIALQQYEINRKIRQAAGIGATNDNSITPTPSGIRTTVNV